MKKQLQKLITVALTAFLFWACVKEKSYEAPRDSKSQWEFKEGGKLYKGPVDTAYFDVVGTQKFLVIEGKSADNRDRITLEVYGDDILPGTYKTPLCNFIYLRDNALLFQNQPTAVDSFAITITKIDSTIVVGTFNGIVSDSSGAARTITNGSFSAKLKGGGVTPPGGNTGTLMLWSAKACGASGPIDVIIAGQSGKITKFPATEPANCGDTGSYTITLPEGTYVWQAVCNGDTLLGNSLVVANTCSKLQVDFTVPRFEGEVSFWSKKGCGTGGTGPIQVTIAGLNGTITSFTPIEPTSCGTTGTYSLKLPEGDYEWTAKCGNETASGTVSVVNNGCEITEVEIGGTTPPPPVVGDYFPTTANSNWSYDIINLDTVYQLSTGTNKTIGANTYNIFTEKSEGSTVDTAYYRKSGGLYYVLYEEESNPFSAVFTNPGTIEITFLRDNLPVNTPWETNTSGTGPTGTVLNGKAKFTIIEKAASATVRGKTFTDVLKVKEEYQAGPTTGPLQTFATAESWYAKGSGLIKSTIQDITGNSITKEVTRLQIN
jgi:hypothetical protein